MKPRHLDLKIKEIKYTTPYYSSLDQRPAKPGCLGNGAPTSTLDFSITANLMCYVNLAVILVYSEMFAFAWESATFGCDLKPELKFALPIDPSVLFLFDVSEAFPASRCSLNVLPVFVLCFNSCL